MDKQFIKWLDALPYPAVAVPAGQGRPHCNRLARRLLPPLPILGDVFDCPSVDFLREVKLDGITYLVVTFSTENGDSVYCFFEHFLPFQEVLSRAIVSKMQDFFWTILNKEEHSDSENVHLLDQIAARACSLRMQGEDYLRLLNVNQILGKESPQTCCLGGFFGHLQRALEVRGIRVSFRFQEDLTVLSEGGVLSFLVLNLVHFVRLFEGERNICVVVTEEETVIRFSVEFPDDGAIASSIEEMIRYSKGSEKLLYTLPLLCILRVCLEKGIPWSLQQREEMFSFSFLLEKGEEIPVLFLSDATKSEVSRLLQMVKLFFM